MNRDVRNHDKEQSSFSDAFGTLARMNMALTRAGYCAEQLDAYGWYHCLRTLNRELRSEMKDENIKQIEILISHIDKEMPIWMRIGKNNKSIHPKLYSLLDSLEILLREIHDVAGFKTFRRDDPRFAK